MSKKKNGERDKRITLDAKHNENIKHFRKIQKSLPDKKRKMNKLIIKYKAISKISNKIITTKELATKRKLLEDINSLKKTIKNIEDHKDETEYYLEVGSLLHNYYENIKGYNSKNNETKKPTNVFNLKTNNKKSDESKQDYRNVLDFFNRRNTNDSRNQNNKFLNNSNESSEISYASTKISDFVKTESNFKRADIFEDYMKKVDENYIPKITIDHSCYQCPNCNIEMTLIPTDGIQVCQKCGILNHVLIESDKPSFKDPPPEISYFAYKRINHFNEFCAQTTHCFNEVCAILMLKYFFSYSSRVFIDEYKKMILSF